jgi:hypothetical protein
MSALSFPGGILTLALCGVLCADSDAIRGVSAEPAQAESPLACAPSALSPAERTRHFDELGRAALGKRAGARTAMRSVPGRSGDVSPRHRVGGGGACLLSVLRHRRPIRRRARSVRSGGRARAASKFIETGARRVKK